MLARATFRVSCVKRPLIRQSCVHIGDPQNPRAQGNLFEPQTVGIAAAVPGLVMPTHQQLRAAIGASPGARNENRSRPPRLKDLAIWSAITAMRAACGFG